MSSAIAKLVSGFKGDAVDYVPYDLDNVKIMYGLPPFKVGGFDYVFASRLSPDARLVMSLNNTGVFVNNQNKSGIIEIGLLNGCFSSGLIQIANAVGIPFPVVITDTSTLGTSTVLGTACRAVETPEWRRELFPSLTVYTLWTPRLLISQGVTQTA